MAIALVQVEVLPHRLATKRDVRLKLFSKRTETVPDNNNNSVVFEAVRRFHVVVFAVQIGANFEAE